MNQLNQIHLKQGMMKCEINRLIGVYNIEFVDDVFIVNNHKHH